MTGPLPQPGRPEVQPGLPVDFEWPPDARHSWPEPTNANTLMMQVYDKRIVEVNHDGEMVLDFDVGGRGRMFRIYKYPQDYPGIVALGLGDS